ncbi:Uncharacterised protein [Burkholderia pseudomallei]|nr:Uncharacterised protein [Burkholderia pseudomallei]CAJ3325087.1 Uncharacterised protein [Burkholderia pseudomallei]CAJ3325108.1 Uncharacterised protein [Burkholderia pseudomallei]CAJ3337957.1 Uncharacterised protein [Burkholderia pseudomallei]CAJ3340496.1 Uncharacterised protein [Burkholderia pseudomallei]
MRTTCTTRMTRTTRRTCRTCRTCRTRSSCRCPRATRSGCTRMRNGCARSSLRTRAASAARRRGSSISPLRISAAASRCRSGSRSSRARSRSSNARSPRTSPGSARATAFTPAGRIARRRATHAARRPSEPPPISPTGSRRAGSRARLSTGTRCSTGVRRAGLPRRPIRSSAAGIGSAHRARRRGPPRPRCVPGAAHRARRRRRARFPNQGER